MTLDITLMFKTEDEELSCLKTEETMNVSEEVSPRPAPVLDVCSQLKVTGTTMNTKSRQETMSKGDSKIMRTGG